MMNQEILWETYYDITLGEQMDAFVNIYKESPAAKAQLQKFKRIFYSSLIFANILTTLFFIYFSPSWLIFKLIGFNILFIAFSIYFLRIKGNLSNRYSEEKVKDWNEVTITEKNEIISSFLHLKHDGIHAKELFFSWEDIIDYYIEQEWLFITSNKNKVFACPLKNMIEEEIEDLLTIFKQKTQLEMR